MDVRSQVICLPMSHPLSLDLGRFALASIKGFVSSLFTAFRVDKGSFIVNGGFLAYQSIFFFV